MLVIPEISRKYDAKQFSKNHVPLDLQNRTVPTTTNDDELHKKTSMKNEIARTYLQHKFLIDNFFANGCLKVLRLQEP